jgi:ubiquinone/menaquinone biosynthesis C-methylase UbiE
MKTKPIPFYNDPAFDYPQYWQTRKYENEAEKMALRKFLKLIPKKQKEKIVDIGAGFGRLTPVYAPSFKNCLLIEPSDKLLQEAKKLSKEHYHLEFKKSFVEKLPVEDSSFNVVLMVRVAHHLQDLEPMIIEVKRILKPNGYFILEFANKIHFKKRMGALFRLNFGFFQNHLPENLKTKRKASPFFNYHPNQIKTLLLSHGFLIIDSLCVSNFRNFWIKKLVPLKLLLRLENIRQEACLLKKFYLGPSVFFLAKKEKQAY